MSPAECSYEIYDKQLMAIIKCLGSWRPELEGRQTNEPVRLTFLSTDNDPLRPHNVNQALRSLCVHSCRTVTKITDPEQLRVAATIASKSNELIDLDALRASITDNTKLDAGVKELKDHIAKGSVPVKGSELRISLLDCQFNDDGALRYRGRLFVPKDQRTQVLRVNYAVPSASHPGRNHTFKLLSRSYFWWPTMRVDVERYVAHYHTCVRAKPSRQSQAGLLKPLPLPTQCWQHVTVDYVTGLPTSLRGFDFDAIMVVVDRITKMRHFIPMVNCGDQEELDAHHIAYAFLDHAWKLHALPSTITSNRGPQFVSSFWRFPLQQIEDRRPAVYRTPPANGWSDRSLQLVDGSLPAHLRQSPW
ncbi:Retrotransposable element [Zymoseptoria brevis]|uniref:Retrotransposable element n=1 Tax=Zymoseptoria brevis TaxID=1047168 RepID=A0A0F4G6Q2_9PEZI|nr:Retrotransposable element [Zymoseptoria brevis]